MAVCNGVLWLSSMRVWDALGHGDHGDHGYWLTMLGIRGAMGCAGGERVPSNQSRQVIMQLMVGHGE